MEVVNDDMGGTVDEEGTTLDIVVMATEPHRGDSLGDEGVGDQSGRGVWG